MDGPSMMVNSMLKMFGIKAETIKPQIENAFNTIARVDELHGKMDIIISGLVKAGFIDEKDLTNGRTNDTPTRALAFHNGSGIPGDG